MNTTAPAENTPQELVPFFDYINRMEVPKDDAFIKALHAQVEKYNTSEWRRKLMTLEEKIKMKADGLNLQVISKYTELSTDEIEKL